MSIRDVERVCAALSQLKTHPDFPKPGVTMLDTWPATSDPALLASLAEMAAAALPLVPGTVYLGMAVRGLLLAHALATRARGSVAPVAKKVKLPADCVRAAPHTTEYDAGEQQIARSVLPRAGRHPAYVVDDVVATGGSARAVVEMLRVSTVRVLGVVALIHIEGLGDPGVPVHAAFRMSPDGAYLGVGSLFHSWLPVRATNFSGPGTPISYYSPRLRHMQCFDPCFARPLPLDTFPGGGLSGTFDTRNLANGNVQVYLDMTDEANLLHSIGFLNILPAQGIRSLKVHLLFYAAGTMERVDREGTIASAETIAKMFHNIPAMPGGLPVLVLYDVRALPIRFYFDATRVRVEMASHFDEKAARIPLSGAEYGAEYCAVLYPDDGARKRYGVTKEFRDMPGIAFSKVRDGPRRAVTVQTVLNSARSAAQLVRAAEKMVVVDDLSRTFGTVLAALDAAQALDAAPGSVDVVLANIAPEGTAIADFFAHAPACFGVLRVSESTQAAWQLSRHPMFGDRVDLLDKYHYCGNTIRVVGTTNRNKMQYGHDLALCVPSGVPAQPTLEQARHGAVHRLRACCQIMRALGVPFIAHGPESGVDDEWHDVSVVAYERDGAMLLAESRSTCVVPPEFRREEIAGDTTFGELMQRAWNLSTPDAWLAHLGEPRSELYRKAYRQEKLLE